MTNHSERRVCGCGPRGISRVWATVYAHDRRKHRHRCRACSRIIEAGERVLMVRIPGRRGTYAIHEAHADEGTGGGAGFTWRQAFSIWSAPEGCRRCGGSGLLPEPEKNPQEA